MTILEELNTIISKNFSDELGTYDFDGIAESVFERIKELEDADV